MEITRQAPDKLHSFIPAKEIAEINRRLGKQISEEYSKLLGPDGALLVISTLKGALLFTSDLIREIQVPVFVDFVRVASYGAGMISSGRIQMIKDIETPAKGKHLLILDEIVDTGRTIDFLLAHYAKAEPASLRVCTLLDKPSRREVQVKVDYIGKSVEDKFLVGYGLDYGERYRNLPDIHYISN